MNPKTLNVRPARVANVRSLIAKALDLAGVRPSNRPVAEVLTPAWRNLFAKLTIGDDRYLRSSLAPFARFCATSGIEPDAVSDQASGRYLEHLEHTALVKQPRDKALRTVCRAWNMARGKVDEWPATVLTVPMYAVTFSLQLAAFPAAFRADLEACLARLSCDDPVDLLDDTAPPRALRPNSIKTKRYQLRVFASALVHTGVPIESIIALEILTRPDNFKRGLRFLLDRPRKDLDNTRSAGFIAHTVRTVAKYWVRVSEADLASIAAITARLSRHEPGMTDKNRARLAQFQDPDVLQRFLDLPSIEIDRLRRKGIAARSVAVRYSNLIAWEILLHAPMRIANLASLTVGVSIRLPLRGQRGEALITLARRTVKNRRQQQYILPEDVTARVAYYVEKVTLWLVDGTTDALFPNSDGRPKRSDTLSKQISAIIRDAAGLEFNPHLFRHLAAKICLDERPGSYDATRRLLGHNSAQTTYESYQGLETDSASRMHSDLIRSKRQYVPNSERPRLGRRLRIQADPVEVDSKDPDDQPK